MPFPQIEWEGHAPNFFSRLLVFDRPRLPPRPERIRGARHRMTSKGDLKMTDCVVGVDVSKDWLDAHRRADTKDRRFPNTKQGRQSLVRWAAGARVAFEPSGPYHRALERHLATAGLDAVKINPLQARRFAEATGKRAKTDAVDARVIATMAATLDLRATPPLAQPVRKLKALQIARNGSYQFP